MKMDKKLYNLMTLKLKNKVYQNKSPVLMNYIDINDIAVSNEFPFVNQVLNILLVEKIIKKLDLYAYSFQK